MQPMFAKIFSQIFDSSIAEDFMVRHMFMDLLVLADKDGVIDMTPKAISGRTGIPLDQVVRTIEILSSPDIDSRSKSHEGRRLIPVDDQRSWGWKIVNYEHYRAIRDEEQRRSYHRTYRAAKRAEAKNAKNVHQGSPEITQAEGDLDREVPKQPTGDLPPTLKQALALVADMRKNGADYTDEEAKQAWNSLEAGKLENGRWRWGKGSIPPGDPRAALESRINDNRDRKGSHGNNSSNNKQDSDKWDRNKGTLNEGKHAQYRGLGKVGRVPDLPGPAASGDVKASG